MAIATEIRVAEYKYDNMQKDVNEIKLKLENSERIYEENLKKMNIELNAQKNYDALVIDNLQLELETVTKELEISRVNK